MMLEQIVQLVSDKPISSVQTNLNYNINNKRFAAMTAFSIDIVCVL